MTHAPRFAVPVLALLLAAAYGAPGFAGERGHGKGAAHDTSGGDPAGNNGTIKVDGVPFDDSKGNEPHVSCDFRIVFYGFDKDQTGDITITGQAPSGSGTVSDRSDLTVSDDAAGGGNDRDASFTYGAGDLDLSGLRAHPKQGYHIKITFSTDTPGGVKHKVIWYQPCAEVLPTEVPSPTPTESPTLSESPTPTPTVLPTETETGTPSPTVSASVLGVKITKPGSKPNVLGTKFTRPLLAFTGSYAALLLAVAAGLLGAGALVLTLARRRRLT